MKKNKHLSYDDRLIVEKRLKERKSFKAIARELNKDCNCIRNEIKKHLYECKYVSRGRTFNNCAAKNDCKIARGHRICDENTKCLNYKKAVCNKLAKPPYCCNGCEEYQKCRLTKVLYQAIRAQKDYKLLKTESRTGITLSENEIKKIDNLLKDLIKDKGQSVHHAYINNIDSMICSERQLYKLIEKGCISIRAIDLPRTVQRKPRKKGENHFKVDKKCRINRTYLDFLEFKNNNKDLSIVEMDSVVGIKGGKCLLTLHVVNCNFMFAFLRDANDSQSVIDIFDYLEKRLGLELFEKLFGIVLTDNGSEFSNPLKLEFNEHGIKRTNIFYCDPGHSEQKGSCENNHELIRRILPSGTSFDNLKQEDIDKIMSHVNSYKRKALNDISPIYLFRTLYGLNIASKFNILSIKPNDIVLNKDLLK